MNTYQIKAFVNHLKKQKNISNEKRKMVSDVIVSSDNNIDTFNRGNIKPKELGDKRITISKR
jgi:hypothetical protein